jgi:hypothetical protein
MSISAEERGAAERRPSTAEQRLALSLMADAVKAGALRTFKQLEKFGFVYKPSVSLRRLAPAARSRSGPVGPVKQDETPSKTTKRNGGRRTRK